MLLIFLCYSYLVVVLAIKIQDINLPDKHIAYYFNQFPLVAEQCKLDENCTFKHHLNETKCWGYEPNCNISKRYSNPICSVDVGWVKSKFEQQQIFYDQGDFGYVKQQLNEMKILCEPYFLDDSSLVCSDHLRFCVGRNILINFTRLLEREEPLRYKMDILSEGDIGGYCELFEDRLKDQCDHISPLQSWGPELRHFKKLKDRPIHSNQCDIVIDKPVFAMKIDATVNLYHHFCDFFNLYASLHVNSSHHYTFSKDVHILIWETYSYHSAFGETWEAFTEHPVWDLKEFQGKVVCFKNIVFPLLPRMIFGLYYNTPLINGCEKSGLFHAFSKFILHRLKIEQKPRKNSKIHITFLSRKTNYRNVLNEKELIEALKKDQNYVVRQVVYNRQLSFKQQLSLTHNSDVFIGMHGAGLTHLLFLPDWAVIFELYNCDDPNCYLDLARLRGIKYITWKNNSLLYQQDDGHHPDGGAHAKFTNYSFDIDEFLKLVKRATIAARAIFLHQAFRGPEVVLIDFLVDNDN